MNRARLLDIAERTGWTAAQAGLGYLATVVTGLPTPWAVPIAAALAILKGAAAGHVGDPATAGTLPVGRRE